MSGVGFDGDAVAIDVQAMDDVRADELDSDGIPRVHFKLGGRIGELASLDPKRSLLMYKRLNRQWRERHHQPSHYKEKKRKTRTHF